MKFREEKIIAKVEKDNKVIETYKIVCGGNCSYRVWRDNDCVNSIFDTAENAADYAMRCAHANPYVLLGKAVVR